jgi:ribonuclease HI
MEDPNRIALRSVAGVEEWVSIHGRSVVKTKVTEHWFPPPMGWIKINIDGAFKHSENWGGGGAVIRDHDGGFIAGACCFFPHVADAEGTELLACKQGILLARDEHHDRVILETDSTVVAAKLSKEGQDLSLNGPLVMEIKSLLRSFARSTVRAVRRLANDAAHRMAKNGCDNKLDRRWRGVAPDCICNRLVLDLCSE